MSDTLSILIPVYNCSALALVQSLVRQAGLRRLRAWEIVVADDASTDARTIADNQSVGTLPCCRYVRLPHNVGRAAIRNYLARTATYTRLLFIDGDMSVVSAHFIDDYLDYEVPVIYGGYTIVGHHPHNLRYHYEQAAALHHQAHCRVIHPYLDFHTSNYAIFRDIALRHPIDESYQGYGYEDVAYGAQLQRAGIVISHISNPVGFYDFESNEAFLAKTEESLRTLMLHADQLAKHSRMLAARHRLCRLGLHLPLRWVYRLMGSRWRAHLVNHPWLWSFKLYKLAFFLSLSAPKVKG